MSEKEPLYKKVNNWRLYPRIFSILYAVLIFQIGSWFMNIDSPSEAQAAFATVVVTSSAAWFRFYVNSGNDTKTE